MTRPSMPLAITDEELQAEDPERLAYNDQVAALREAEYPMLKGTTYLDHAGTPPPPSSLLATFSTELTSTLFGNPHSSSSSLSAQTSSQRIDHVRLRVLRLFNADPTHFDVIFVANATAGLKIVGECLGNVEAGFWFGYHRDAHTSLVGVRELARRGRRFGSDEEVEGWLSGELEKGIGLFAYPAQSNMHGGRLPMDWCGRLRRARQQGQGEVYSLLDAAALVSTSPLDLSSVENVPDFTVLSFYKMFGFPDLGALIVRKDSGHLLRTRRYFGGGTVEAVSCTGEQWCFRKQGALHEALEDGTLPVHSIIALDCAITVHERLFVGFEHIAAHTGFLARLLHQRLKQARHSNGHSVCEIYGGLTVQHSQPWDRGPTIAFNFKDGQGCWVSNNEVQKLAAVKNIHLRTGNLCNPGGVSHALGLQPKVLKDNFAAGVRCGSEQDIVGDRPTGVIRISLGATSTLEDVQNFLQFVDEFFVDKGLLPEPIRKLPLKQHRSTIASLIVYPIKSCGGWQIPHDRPWPLRAEGLAWDREWCLVHQGTRAALSQKRFPRMALFKPSFNIPSSRLRIRWTGPPDTSGVPGEVHVPLTEEPAISNGPEPMSKDCETNVCGDKIQPLIYASHDITTFFSTHLRVPVFLARFPSSPDSISSLKTRCVKSKPTTQSHLDPKPTTPMPTAMNIPGSFPTPPPSPPPTRPLLLANESPLLVIFLSSLDALNAAIRANGGSEVSPDAFRANIVLDDRSCVQPHRVSPPPPLLRPSSLGSNPIFGPPLSAASEPTPPRPLVFAEDALSNLSVSTSAATSSTSSSSSSVPSPPASPPATELALLGPCRRCQMVCVDQDTGERGRGSEPFATLAKVRRWGGGCWFGMHAALDEHGRGARGERGERTVKVGDGVVGR
ncbi:MAG: hypothetical protein LQ340_007722 [Diploschistes diacapsis]|nr:MAG: hypothetical protein LQ340_007722 [Diploschistes diacapsis]